MRQIILSGTGTVFITGCWGINQTIPQDADNRIEDNLLLGYEIGADYSLCQTETFWHYWRGKDSLFDQRLSKGKFFTQNTALKNTRVNASMLERVVDAFLNGLGSFFGF